MKLCGLGMGIVWRGRRCWNDVVEWQKRYSSSFHDTFQAARGTLYTPQTFPIIHTIGHSNHTWERFAELLVPYEIDLLVDVRSYPRSRFAPWSNHDRIECNLARIGVEYLWKGDSLGGMPRGSNKTKDSEPPSVDEWYEQRAIEPDFEAGIVEVSRLARRKRLAVMCSEGDASRCHRSLLLAPKFIREGCKLLHINPKGFGASTQLRMG